MAQDKPQTIAEVIAQCCEEHDEASCELYQEMIRLEVCFEQKEQIIKRIQESTRKVMTILDKDKPGTKKLMALLKDGK